jgi:hypothetical protein
VTRCNRLGWYILETVAYGISDTSDSSAIVEASYTIPSPYVFGNGPRAGAPSRYLHPTLDQLCWRGYNESGEAACSTRTPDFGKALRNRGRIAKVFESAIVGHEEYRIEGAVAEDGRCSAYTTVSLLEVLFTLFNGLNK